MRHLTYCVLLVSVLNLFLEFRVEGRRLQSTDPMAEASKKAEVLFQKTADSLSELAVRAMNQMEVQANSNLDNMAKYQPGDLLKQVKGNFDHMFKKQPQDINVVVPAPASSPAPQVRSLPVNPPSNISISGGGMQTITRTPTVIENPFNLVAPTKITDLSYRQGSKLGGLTQLLGTLFGYTVPGASQG